MLLQQTLKNPERAEFTLPGLELHPIGQIMANAGRHQAGKIIASQSIINRIAWFRRAQ
jgi:hypothetical protein